MATENPWRPDDQPKDLARKILALLAQADPSATATAIANMSGGIPRATTAFDFMRVAAPEVIFDCKMIFDNQPLKFSELLTNSATAEYIVNNACVEMKNNPSQASSAVRQTWQRFNYQPGRGQLILLTRIFNLPTAGVTKYSGYNDAENGVYYYQNSSDIGIGLRSFTSGSAVNIEVQRSNWNGDKLDGTGPSGMVLDPTKTQIFWIDFEWLGVGTVRWGVFHNGKPTICHTIDNNNRRGQVYMSTPNLPIRDEIVSTGAASITTLTQICTAVISEGGTSPTHIHRSADRGITPYVTGINTNIHPLLSIRLKSTYKGATIEPIALSIASDSGTKCRWAILLAPTVAGSDNASWVNITNSPIQYDVSRTNANTLSGGTQLASGYLSSQQEEVTSFDFSNYLALGFSVSNVPLELVLAVQNTSSSNESYFAAMNFAEVY